MPKPFQPPSFEEDLADARRNPFPSPVYQINLPGIAITLSEQAANKIVSRLLVLIGGSE